MSLICFSSSGLGQAVFARWKLWELVSCVQKHSKSLEKGSQGWIKASLRWTGEWFLTKTEVESGLCGFVKVRRWKENIFLSRVDWLDSLPLGSKLKYNLSCSNATPAYATECLQYGLIIWLLLLPVSCFSLGPDLDYTGLISCHKFFSNTQQKKRKPLLEISSRRLWEDQERILAFWLLSTASPLFQELICELQKKKSFLWSNNSAVALSRAATLDLRSVKRITGWNIAPTLFGCL